MGATFSRLLFSSRTVLVSFLYTIGKQTAKEMRATGSHWTFTPNIDILRDPRWGRVGETFGEDPFMVGNMGAAMIQGFQQDDFTGTEKVIACAKHMYRLCKTYDWWGRIN